MPIPAGPNLDPADLPPEHSMQVGDNRTPTLRVVAPNGALGSTSANPPTAVTLTVTPPGGTPQSKTVTSPDSGITWVGASYPLTTPGRWVEQWTVTGAGADTLYTVVLVHAAPTPGGQTWIPTREQVAAYVPRRTHVGYTLGSGATLGTFTADTRPSADTVDRLIVQAAQWVELVAGPIVVEAIADSATAAAALWAAAFIELQWPDSADDLAHGKVLLDQATSMRRDVAARNVAETGTDPVVPVSVLPAWSFPPATELRF